MQLVAPKIGRLGGVIWFAISDINACQSLVSCLPAARTACWPAIGHGEMSPRARGLAGKIQTEIRTAFVAAIVIGDAKRRGKG